jgi:hypothetical protein
LNTGWRPIHWFARYGDFVLLERFIGNGAHAHFPEFTYGLFPIQIAGLMKYENSPKIVKLLVEDFIVKVKKL